MARLAGMTTAAGMTRRDPRTTVTRHLRTLAARCCESSTARHCRTTDPGQLDTERSVPWMPSASAPQQAAGPAADGSHSWQLGPAADASTADAQPRPRTRDRVLSSRHAGTLNYATRWLNERWYGAAAATTAVRGGWRRPNGAMSDLRRRERSRLELRRRGLRLRLRLGRRSRDSSVLRAASSRAGELDLAAGAASALLSSASRRGEREREREREDMVANGSGEMARCERGGAWGDERAPYFKTLFVNPTRGVRNLPPPLTDRNVTSSGCHASIDSRHWAPTMDATVAHLARDAWAQYCRTLATVRHDAESGATGATGGTCAAPGVGAGVGAGAGGDACCSTASSCTGGVCGWTSARIDYREGGEYTYLNTGTGMVERNCILFPPLIDLLPADDADGAAPSANSGSAESSEGKAPEGRACGDGGCGAPSDRGFGECTRRQRALWTLVRDEFAARYSRDGVAWCIWVEEGSPAHTLANDLTLMPGDKPAGSCCSAPAPPYFEVWPEQGMVLTLGGDATAATLARYRPTAGPRDGTCVLGDVTMELLSPGGSDRASTSEFVAVLCDAFGIPSRRDVREPVTALLSGRTWGTGTPLRLVVVRDNDTGAVVGGGSVLMLDDGNAAVFEVSREDVEAARPSNVDRCDRVTTRARGCVT